MAYAPINIRLYCAAYDGAIAGMNVSGRVITDPSASSYIAYVAMAGAWAQAFDLAWNDAADPDVSQVQLIQSASQDAWQNRAPQPSAVSLSVDTYTNEVLALAGLLSASDTYLSAQGIVPPTAGGGGGGGSPTGPAGGDLGGTYPNPTVPQINGSSVPLGGGLTIGNTLAVTGAAALAYAALNLAGGPNFVSGVLPAANQAAQTMAGDVTGTTAANVVEQINGASVPVSGALVAGNGLRVLGLNTLIYSALNLAGGAGWVTGVLPAANQAAQTMGGDVTGTTAASVVAKINGATVPASGALVTGNGPYVSGVSALTYSALDLAGGAGWVTGVLPAANQAAQTMGGDVTGTTAASVVAKINGATVPASGALVTGNGPYVSGVSALTYSALDLAGGAGWVTGVLPAANQAAQTMGGDVTGTTAASVVAKINGATVPASGALVTGNGPYVSGVSALTYSALNLAGGAGWVTGVLPAANQAAQTMGGDVTGTTAASVVEKLTGNTGLVTVNTNTTAIRWGSTSVAASGLLRFPNNVTAIAFRNSGDTADTGTIAINASNTLILTSSGSITLNGGVTCNFNIVVQGAGISFGSTATASITQSVKSGNGGTMTLTAQGSSGANGNGGTLLLTGGALNGTGIGGGVQIARNGVATATSIELTELVLGRRVLALNRGAVLTTTEMPANTGDLVTYIGNSATIPSANPVSGGILYVSAGALGWWDTAGVMTLGLVANPMALNASTITINNATAILHGTSPAATGDFRVKNTWAMIGRNAANSADLGMISVTSGNLIQIGATGVGAIVSSTLSVGSTVTLSGSVLGWSGGATTPTINQGAKSGNGALMTIVAQGSNAANGNGGALLLMGGALNGSGLSGGVQIARNGVATATAIELTELVAGQRVLALNRGAVLTTTEMPANTGDLVIYIGNAATAPTASSVSGGILYCEAGALKYRGTGGTVTTLGAA